MNDNLRENRWKFLLAILPLIVIAALDFLGPFPSVERFIGGSYAIVLLYIGALRVSESLDRIERIERKLDVILEREGIDEAST